jgi:hypothetical protein
MSRGSSPAAGAPTVFFMDLDAGVREAALSSPRGDDVARFLQGDMGHSGLEASTWILSRQPTTLTVALYYGRVGDELNWRVSLMLRRQVFCRAAVVCVEEDTGCSAIGLGTLLRKLGERSLCLPEYTDKDVPGRIGDLLHNMSLYGTIELDDHT